MTTPPNPPNHEGLCDLIEDRIGQNFDGECHLTEDDARAITKAIRDLVADNARLTDKVEGLDADLRLAVQAAWKRGAREWAFLNYPSLVPWLKASDEAEAIREEARAALSGRVEG